MIENERESRKTVLLMAHGGRAVTYLFHTDVVRALLNSNIRVVGLVDDVLVDRLTEEFKGLDVVFESRRHDACRRYVGSYRTYLQLLVDFLRRCGVSSRMNLGAVLHHQRLTESQTNGKWKAVLVIVRPFIWMMRRIRLLRTAVAQAQTRWFTADIYGDLFTKYRPVLAVSSSPGWFWDRFFLREAKANGISTAAVVIGWDHPNSKGAPGAPVDRITCWSETQKAELVDGSDWNPSHVNMGGAPAYDSYVRGESCIPREAYFQKHGLDPDRRLLAYACTFVSYSPNIQNINALARLVAGDELVENGQLLVRLHPRHFQGEIFERERDEVLRLADVHPHVHVVEPKALAGKMARYSSEDSPELTSMLRHCDVFLSVFSTMVVEAGLCDKPIISTCLDSNEGWGDRYWLRLSQVGHWPTHSRLVESKAGRVALNADELRNLVNAYLENPALDRDNRKKFVIDECTYVDGSAGRRTGEFLVSLT
jgi:hypothetical protein